MTQLKNVLDRLLKLLAGVSFTAMVVLTCWQVATRYILKNPSSWSEELVSYLFAWMSLLGASIVAGERGHMNIPILVERLGPGGRRAFAIFSELAAFAFSAVILVLGGIRIADLAMGQTTSSLGVPIGFFYTILPLSGALNVIYAVINIYGIATGQLPAFSGEGRDIGAKGGKEHGD